MLTHQPRYFRIYPRCFFSLAAISPLFFQPRGFGTGRGAVACAPIREKDPAADGANPGFRGRAVLRQCGLQHRIKGQNGLPEVAAKGPRPALAQHIAITVQRQAAAFFVIVGAPLCHQLADRGLFLAGQLPAHSSPSSSRFRHRPRRQRHRIRRRSSPRTQRPFAFWDDRF